MTLALLGCLSPKEEALCEDEGQLTEGQRVSHLAADVRRWHERRCWGASLLQQDNDVIVDLQHALRALAGRVVCQVDSIP